MAVFMFGRSAVPFAAKDIFSENTWQDIATACQLNKIPVTWAIGDQKTMTIGGAEYVIDIIGKNHDTYSDGTGVAPLTFQLHDCLPTKYQMNVGEHNDGGWLESDMRLTTFHTIYNQLPIEVRSNLRQVNKVSSTGHQRTTLNTARDTLFLLSEIEIYGEIPLSVSGEGKQYAYYANGGSTVKKVKNSASIWWQRSPFKGNPTVFCAANASGIYNYEPANESHGVSPAFCF
jgi:hypothetical protein